MLHPSYSDLIRVVNSEVEEGEQPVVQSRYSIVIATAKRARQIIAGAEPLVEDAGKKPLCPSLWKSFYNGAVKILILKMKKSRMKWFQQPMGRLRRKQRKPKNRKRKQWKNNLKIGQNILPLFLSGYFASVTIRRHLIGC